jgi:hypothetical protein
MKKAERDRLLDMAPAGYVDKTEPTLSGMWVRRSRQACGRISKRNAPQLARLMQLGVADQSIQAAISRRIYHLQYRDTTYQTGPVLQGVGSASHCQQRIEDSADVVFTGISTSQSRS